MADHLAIAGDVFDGVLFCAVLFFFFFFFFLFSWMRSGSKLSQFLRIFLSTLVTCYFKGSHKQEQLEGQWRSG